MNEPLAVLDACVLYPASLRDLLMHLTLADAFRARWTETIHEEWIGNLLLNRPDLKTTGWRKPSNSSKFYSSEILKSDERTY